jgi:hypothetical protein
MPIVLCRCRECEKIYREDKATADWKGYCSQKCVHKRSRKFGFNPTLAKKKAYPFHTEYDVLNRAKQIGSVFV